MGLSRTPDVLLTPGVSLADENSAAAPRAVVRRSEWVIAAFLTYAAITAVILPVAPPVRNLVVLLNLAVILAYGLLVHFDSANRMAALSIARDWLPLVLIVLAYREMGWFALPHLGHALEAHWVIWDRMVLRGGVKAAIEAFGPILPAVLEIAYMLVYALAPFALAMLYIYGHRDQVDHFLLIFAVAVLLCYAQFPFWPSEPPRAVFFGEDSPLYDTVFRHLNWWMLGNYGIHTSVFPSAHVAGAFAAAFGMRRAMPRPKWVSRFLLAMALLIAVATVYGRYHYIADVAAGFLMAVLALAMHYQPAIMKTSRDACGGPCRPL
jgi:membrane-associated phospholipid phosphatase